jgi:hypothetical protein
MEDQIAALPAAPTDLPPLGGRTGLAEAAGKIKRKHRRTRQPDGSFATPGAPAAPIQTEAPRYSQAQADQIAGLVVDQIIKPALGAAASRIDKAAQEIKPDFTFALSQGEEQALKGLGAECVKTLPYTENLPRWVPWVMLAVTAGGMTWARYNMAREIRAARIAAEARAKAQDKAGPA